MATMTHTLPPLPFEKNALQPHISAETLEYHYGKHHKTYVDKLNGLIPGTEFESKTLEDIIRTSSGPIFNNAAQVWNHTFFWNSISPQSTQPKGELLKAIQRDFGSLDKLKEEFTKAAVAAFGSCWIWLVATESGKLAVQTTQNADTPLKTGKAKPLLTLDVWEHAYYIDYRNDRAKFIASFWNLVNWDFAGKNLI